MKKGIRLLWIYRLGVAFKTRTVARSETLLRLFENSTVFAVLVCPKCGRFLRIGLRFENRQCGGIGREGFVNVGLWRGEVGTKKRENVVLIDSVSALFFKMGWHFVLKNQDSFYFLSLCVFLLMTTY